MEAIFLVWISKSLTIIVLIIFNSQTTFSSIFLFFLNYSFRFLFVNHFLLFFSLFFFLDLLLLLGPV